ncbi:OPT superfamily oligopeptide transporter [Ramicandelaber brevisporus]|nr:OPT superfamily oligopeptide transporter [Ramicandelaber brevisporus]
MLDDSIPHFTWRSLIVGLLIGCLVCFSNTFYGLQSGWISMMALQSIMRALLSIAKNAIPFTPAENVILQTTAVATGTMPLAAGYVGILPALRMLTKEDNPGGPVELNYGQMILWGIGLAFFGVFFAVPLRRQAIIKEKLRFPSGTATAQLISVLHRVPDPTLAEEVEERRLQQSLRRRNVPGNKADDDEEEERALNGEDSSESTPAIESAAAADASWTSKWIGMLVSFVLSGVYTILAYFYPVISTLKIFGNVAYKWQWWLTPSLSYAGQGAIMGVHTTTSMMLGAIVGWGILSPIAKNNGWAPGDVGNWKNGSKGWILWISLAVMIAESFVSLGVMTYKELRVAVPRLLAAYRNRGRLAVSTDDSYDPDLDPDNLDVRPHHLVPTWVVVGGLVISCILCIVACVVIFDVKWYASLLGVILACLLSILGVRALGETDLNPVSGIGKISQIVFAGVTPGNVVANIVAGGVAEAGAQQAGDLMQDLKTGHLLHASPRAQFYGQMVGSFVSVFVSAAVYMLYISVYKVPGPEFPAPTAQVWLDMAKLVNGHQLPDKVGYFVIGFAIIFALLPIVEHILTVKGYRRVARLMPSGIAFAIGMYNTPNFSIARFLGSIVAHVWITYGPGGKENLASRRVMTIIVASGFVLGEGTLSLVTLGLKAAGVQPHA